MNYNFPLGREPVQWKLWEVRPKTRNTCNENPVFAFFYADAYDKTGGKHE